MKNANKVIGATVVALAGAAAGCLLGASGVRAQTAAEYGGVARSTAGSVRAAGPVQMTISMAPPAHQVQAAARGPNCVGPMRDERSVIVPVGKSTMLELSEAVRNRTLGDPAVVQAQMVSPKTLYLLGLSVGTTNMIVQGRSGSCSVIDVVVNADPGGLQASLSQLLPDERGIRVSTAGSSLVLAGHVSSALAAQQAVEIARAYVQQSKSVPGAPGGGGSPGQGGHVMNMLQVDAPQQVMLEVKVAEVSKTLVNEMGASLNLQGGFGTWTGAFVSQLLSGASSAIVASKANKLPFTIAADAQHNDNLVKILAEPNLVTLSGHEASFLSGGKIFIPVPQSSGTGTTTITLQEEEFGVALKFLPTVLKNGVINLKVSPEVSELSPTGVTLSSTNVAGISILPLITTRRASTTVQMRDGETFAIGGLLQDNASGAIKAFPGLGEVPVLGALFRSTNFQQDKTELVFIITPRLVHPLQAGQTLPLPTDSFSTPSEVDVYATGNMEGRRGLPGKQGTQDPKAGTPQSGQPGQPAQPESSAQPQAVPQPDSQTPQPVSQQRVPDAAISQKMPAPVDLRGQSVSKTDVPETPAKASPVPTPTLASVPVDAVRGDPAKAADSATTTVASATPAPDAQPTTMAAATPAAAVPKPASFATPTAPGNESIFSH